MGDNRELQEEELCALEAIYGDDVCIDREQRTVQLFIPNRVHRPRLVLQIHLPDEYPATTPPIIELQAGHLSDDLIKHACHDLEQQFMPGEVVLYNWAERLKEQADLYQLQPAAAGGSSNGHQQQHHQGSDVDGGDSDYVGEDEDELENEEALLGIPEGGGGNRAAYDSWHGSHHSEDLMDAMRHKIVSAEPHTERKSTFQAHVAPVTSYAEVQCVVAILLESNKIRNATHNIMAYRIHVPEKGTFLQDYDDDGEAAAGGRLLHLLQVADARDVVVVVSRWFGGILLGPSRFTHINNTARLALEAEGYIRARGVEGGSGSKKAGSKGGKSKGH